MIYLNQSRAVLPIRQSGLKDPLLNLPHHTLTGCSEEKNTAPPSQYFSEQSTQLGVGVSVIISIVSIPTLVLDRY